MENNIVKVKLWGQEVGLLYWDKKSHKAIFEYNPAFVRNGVDRYTTNRTRATVQTNGYECSRRKCRRSYQKLLLYAA